MSVDKEDTSTGSKALLASVILCLGFQVVHALEHVLQLGYWALHPAAAPWLTPWAAVGRDVLAATADGHPVSGNELLHLGGNVIFLVGLVGLRFLLHQHGMRPHRSLMVATWLQAAHVIEHVALSLSWFATARAIGLTTLFGGLQGTAGAGVRVWAHFLLNVVATTYLLHGLALQARGRSLGRPVESPTVPASTVQGDAL